VTIGKFISCVSKNGTDSGKAMDLLFMPRAEGPCRFGQYATLQSRILERAGLGHAGVFSSVTSEDGYAFLTPAMELQIWRATCLGDMLFKLRCRTVPYHPDPQVAKGLFDEALGEICLRLLSGQDWKETVHSLVRRLGRSLGNIRQRKPLVGVVGEIFVRMNTFSNQNVIEAIEAGGGEAWLSPMTEWLYYVWEDVSRKSGLLSSMKTSIKSRFLHMVEGSIGALFSPLLDGREEPPLSQVISRGEHFVPMEFEGEAILTIGRAKMFAEQGAALVVNCSPFCCMPGRITSYLFQKHPEYFKVPVVNLFFDGIGDVVSQVAIYLKSITQDAAACSPL
jgi:predicted nucleotide-binding protein (sugar kinase/HSP70/actin superfamily)